MCTHNEIIEAEISLSKSCHISETLPASRTAAVSGIAPQVTLSRQSQNDPSTPFVAMDPNRR
jgi:hypothetical protein